MNNIKKVVPQNLKNIAHIITKRKKVRNTLTFGVDLVKHCNLKCKGCDHFSCIANEQYADYDAVKQDFERLKKIFGNRVEQIKFLGGEPLLNRDICKFLTMGRAIFPSAKIVIISNGTLLFQQNEEFWNTCRENSIELNITHYPIPFDYDKAQRLAESKGVSYKYQGLTGSEQKKMYCVPIDVDGKQSYSLSYKMCSKGNECVTLENGKLYTCTLIPNIHFFNQIFNKSLMVTENDYIDIYGENDPDSILNRLAKPVPFCRYCDNLHFRSGIIWETTKGDIKEWT